MFALLVGDPRTKLKKQLGTPVDIRIRKNLARRKARRTKTPTPLDSRKERLLAIALIRTKAPRREKSSTETTLLPKNNLGVG